MITQTIAQKVIMRWLSRAYFSALLSR